MKPVTSPIVRTAPIHPGQVSQRIATIRFPFILITLAITPLAVMVYYLFHNA